MWIVSDYMKVVVIKNLTNEPLTNIIISHDGEGSNKFKIKKLPPNSFQEASLYILRVKENCNFILKLDCNGITKTKVVYDKINANNLEAIILEVSDVSTDLNTNLIISN